MVTVAPVAASSLLSLKPSAHWSSNGIRREKSARCVPRQPPVRIRVEFKVLAKIKGSDEIERTTGTHHKLHITSMFTDIQYVNGYHFWNYIRVFMRARLIVGLNRIGVQRLLKEQTLQDSEIQLDCCVVFLLVRNARGALYFFNLCVGWGQVCLINISQRSNKY